MKIVDDLKSVQRTLHGQDIVDVTKKHIRAKSCLPARPSWSPLPTSRKLSLSWA